MAKITTELIDSIDDVDKLKAINTQAIALAYFCERILNPYDRFGRASSHGVVPQDEFVLNDLQNLSLALDSFTESILEEEEL